MMSPLSRDDLDALSAYLDGALSAQDRAALESRLAAETELRTALDDLRRTVRILRAAPRLAVPRNYTLDPARFSRRAPWWIRLDVFRTMGLLGAAASTALIVLGVLLGQSGVFSTSAPQTSQGDQVAMQASLTDDEVGAEQRGTEPADASAEQGSTATRPADLVRTTPSAAPLVAASPSQPPFLSGEDAQSASRQADNETAPGPVEPPSQPAPGVVPPAPAEPATLPTLTALANFAADTVEAGAAAPTAQTAAAPGVLGESGPELATQITATSTTLPTRTPLSTVTGRLEATVLAATTEKSSAPASPTSPSTSVAMAPLPTEAPSPEGNVQVLSAEDPLPRLLVVAGMSLLVLSVVTLLIGMARRSRP